MPLNQDRRRIGLLLPSSNTTQEPATTHELILRAVPRLAGNQAQVLTWGRLLWRHVA